MQLTVKEFFTRITPKISVIKEVSINLIEDRDFLTVRDQDFQDHSLDSPIKRICYSYIMLLPHSLRSGFPKSIQAIPPYLSNCFYFQDDCKPKIEDPENIHKQAA